VQHITLRHTDLTVSRICLGTMTFGGQTDEAEAARIVDHCLDAGVNFFDTANVYNKGASENMLGRILRGRRSGVVLASKVRGKMGDGPNENGLSRAAIVRALDDTLRRLGTDYLDLYYLHQPDYDVSLDESLEAMDQLVRIGKVRWPASSNYASWQVCRMLWLAETHSYKPARITQPMYNLLARGIEQEYLPMAKEFGVSTVVYNPLAGGLLTGKQRREAPIPGTRFDDNQLYLDRYWHPAYFDAVDRLGAVAASAGRSLVSLALNWLLHHSPADCLILGASRLDQMAENLRAAGEGPLPEDVGAACDKVWADLRGITPKYNR
jgi:1-deoxyxylulose-5-phosphate synthase